MIIEVTTTLPEREETGQYSARVVNCFKTFVCPSCLTDVADMTILDNDEKRPLTGNGRFAFRCTCGEMHSLADMLPVRRIEWHVCPVIAEEAIWP